MKTLAKVTILPIAIFSLTACDLFSAHPVEDKEQINPVTKIDTLQNAVVDTLSGIDTLTVRP